MSECGSVGACCDDSVVRSIVTDLSFGAIFP
jgi:hypothetical protein